MATKQHSAGALRSTAVKQLNTLHVTLLASIISFVSGTAHALTIDAFNFSATSSQSVGTQAVSPASASGQVGPDIGIIGAGSTLATPVAGYRDVLVFKTTGIAGSTREAKVDIGPDALTNTLSINNGNNNSNVYLVWDGAYQVSNTINTNLSVAIDQVGLFSGTTGIDLTDGGLQTGIKLNVLSIDTSASATFTIFSGKSGSSATASSSLTLPFSTVTDLFFPFLSFTGVDFTNVGAIVLKLSGGNNWDGEIDLVQSATIPEPMTPMLIGLGLTSMAYLRRRRITS